MSKHLNQLHSHQGLDRRKKFAETSVQNICKALQSQDTSQLLLEQNVSVYLVGSLGRGEPGKRSDLDLFLITTNEATSRLAELEILSCVIEVNRKLKYGAFSNDGRYLKIYRLTEMLDALGTPRDDSENLFTARMLLLLESRCVFNPDVFNHAVTKMLEHYFRDSRGKKNFRPMFLLNDILRYWRTLCLNYESIRDDFNKPWRKKNINLKFSRMITIFGTVLPLIANSSFDKTTVRTLMSMTPHERFAHGLDALVDISCSSAYIDFLDDYECFLTWKERDDQEVESADESFDNEARRRATRFAQFIYDVLMSKGIEHEYRRYLIL